MQLLLTGATGFVGGALLGRLAAAGHRVRALVREPARLPAELQGDPRLEVRRGSLDDASSLAGVCAGIEAVVHVAGLISARRSSEYFRVNQRGTALLAADARLHAPGARWIQISSLAATGPGDPVRDGDPPHPVSVYGASKLAGERALAASGVENWIVLRPPAVYGPGDRAFLPFFRSAARGRRVALPAGRPARISLIHSADLAAAVLAALAAAPRQQVYHVAAPDPVTPGELLQAMSQSLGLERPARVLPVPFPVVWGAALLAEPLRRLTGRPRFLSLDKTRELGAPAWCCDASRAERDLGWSCAFALAEGLADTAAYYRRAGWLNA